MIRDASFNCGRCTERLMLPSKIIIHHVKRDGCGVVLDFLAERICQASEAPHPHPHRKVGALNVAGGNVAWIGTAEHSHLFAANARCRAVACRTWSLSAVDLVKNGVVYIVRNGINDREQIN